MTEISKTSYDQMQRKVPRGITRRGCLRGCMTLIIIALSIYGLIYGLTAWNAVSELTTNHNKWRDLKPKIYAVTVKSGTLGGIYGVSHESIFDGRLIKTTTGVAQPAIDWLFDQARGCVLDPIIFLVGSNMILNMVI